MTSVDPAYQGAHVALAAELGPLEAARVEAAYRREERAAIAAEAEKLEKRDASNGAAQGGSFSPRVLGITDPALGLAARPREPKGPMEAETLRFRVTKAARDAAIAVVRDGEADRIECALVAELEAIGLEPTDRTKADALREAAQHARGSAAWHRGRARGELERFERLEECEDDLAVWGCRERAGGCGAEGITPVRCGSKFCVTCRGHAAALARLRFGVGRLRRVQDMARAGLTRRRRRGGRWSEKFLTFTVPHCAWDDIAWDEIPRGERAPPIGSAEKMDRDVIARVWLLSAAYRQVWIRIRKAWREAAIVSKETSGLVALHRNFEWTPGTDGLGHPHFHCYLFGPFVPREDLHAWWVEALEAAGYRQPEEADDPIHPDIREIATRPEQIAREVAKGRGHNLKLTSTSSGAGAVHAYACGWSIAEYAKGEGRARPSVLARLYEAITDRRLSQGSPGFLPPRLRGCPQCGRCGSVAFELQPRGTDAAELLERIALRCDGALVPPPRARAPDAPS